MPDTDRDTETPTTPITIWDEPAKIADFIKRRKTTAPEGQEQSYNFADFVGEVGTTDFNDPYQIRATLESQAHILGTAFQYLMMQGDWKTLHFTLKTQKVMRDTIEMMDMYPPLQYVAPDRESYSDLIKSREMKNGETLDN